MGFQLVMERNQSSSAVLAAIKERLAPSWTSDPATVLDAVVADLTAGRGYSWAGIFLATVDTNILQASSGPAPVSTSLEELPAEIAIPIKLGARTLGLIVAEIGRPAGSQDRALLLQVAKLLARYFTSDRAKLLLRKTREKTPADKSTTRLHKNPQSARSVLRKAAAGE